jgi:hypothetical protein
MPNSFLDKQQQIPMIHRRHGDVTPKTRGHTLGERTPAYVYTRELDSGDVSVAPKVTPFDPTKSKVPNFIANDKKVLRFEGYFLEAVHESNLENFRVRKCSILYYLEDDTIQVIEPKVENSGLLQGNFVKRHKIPKPEFERDGHLLYYTHADLNIGVEITIYSRTFHIKSADAFTRSFLEAQGRSVAPDQKTPRDAYSEDRKQRMSRETGQDMHAHYGKKQYPMKEFMEASLGKFARPSDHRKRFNDYDRHVLRWFAMWDDTATLYGTKHMYTIHFFLADNTIEIRESYERNSGCDPFPKLLNRARLLKQPSLEGPFATALSKSNESSDDPSDYFGWEDMSVGATLNMYNRSILLLDADASTREWYADHGIEIGPAMVLPDTRVKPTPFVPPPYNGIGSEQDSLASCYHLTPKPHPKTLEETDNKIVLRFCAYMDTSKPEDIHRRFILSVMACDWSMMIMEPPQRNSGIGGGKFLERGVMKDPATNEPFRYVHHRLKYPLL